MRPRNFALPPSSNSDPETPPQPRLPPFASQPVPSITERGRRHAVNSMDSAARRERDIFRAHVQRLDSDAALTDTSSSNDPSPPAGGGKREGGEGEGSRKHEYETPRLPLTALEIGREIRLTFELTAQHPQPPSPQRCRRAEGTCLDGFEPGAKRWRRARCKRGRWGESDPSLFACLAAPPGGEK